MTDHPCPAPEHIADFYLDALSEAEADAVREHLAGCAACRAVAADARRFVEAMRSRGNVSPTARRRAVYAAAAAAGGITLIAVVMRLAGVGAPDEAPLWQVTPAPYAASDELVWRDGGPAVAISLDVAASRYRAGDYAGAVADLGAHVAAHPDDSRGRFFLGVSRLLSGDPVRAVVDLEAAAGASGAPAEAPFYLALARLEAKDTSGARTELETIAAASGPHRDDAREILRRLEQRNPP